MHKEWRENIRIPMLLKNKGDAQQLHRHKAHQPHHEAIGDSSLGKVYKTSEVSVHQYGFMPGKSTKVRGLR